MAINLSKFVRLVKETTIMKRITLSIKNDLINYRKLLRQKGIKVSQIILFGSVVKGTSDKHSDIDIAVVSPSFGKNYHRELHKLMMLSHYINYDIEPHPFHERELNNKYNALANEIKKYGLEVK